MVERISVETTSEDETRALGARLGEVAAPGDVVLLEGEFGAGKTTFVQGIAQGLGVEGPVTSPSFVIASEYQGRIPLYHIDLYRVDVMDTTTLEAIAEYIGSDGICVVEWPSTLPPDLIPNATRIRFAITGERRRRLEAESPEPRIRSVFAQAAVAG